MISEKEADPGLGQWPPASDPVDETGGRRAREATSQDHPVPLEVPEEAEAHPGAAEAQGHHEGREDLLWTTPLSLKYTWPASQEAQQLTTSSSCSRSAERSEISS